MQRLGLRTWLCHEHRSDACRFCYFTELSLVLLPLGSMRIRLVLLVEHDHLRNRHGRHAGQPPRAAPSLHAHGRPTPSSAPRNKTTPLPDLSAGGPGGHGSTANAVRVGRAANSQPGATRCTCGAPIDSLWDGPRMAAENPEGQWDGAHACPPAGGWIDHRRAEALARRRAWLECRGREVRVLGGG